jgi:hypothetical protein
MAGVAVGVALLWSPWALVIAGVALIVLPEIEAVRRR